jgi:hypothetical protein
MYHGKKVLTVVVNNSTNFKKTNKHISSNTTDHHCIWGWKSSSWLRTGTNIRQLKICVTTAWGKVWIVAILRACL